MSVNFKKFLTIVTSNISSIFSSLFLLLWDSNYEYVARYKIGWQFLNVLVFSVPFFFFSSFLSLFYVWEISVDISSSSLIPSWAMSNLLVSLSKIIFIFVIMFLILTFPYNSFLNLLSLCLDYWFILMCYLLFPLTYNMCIIAILNSLNNNFNICVISEPGSDTWLV